MAPSRTRTMKNKNAGPKTSSAGGDTKRSATSGVSKSKKGKPGPVVSQQVKEKNRAALLKKPKKKVYTAEELNIPKLNMITPVGVVKPRGKKRGQDLCRRQGKLLATFNCYHTVLRAQRANLFRLQEGMNTILSLVQAEKEGQIESKMIKARQLEEIREARRVEAEKKEEEKKTKLENMKDSLRKKRNRKSSGKEEENLNEVSSMGTKATKPKKKSVSFA
uniref:60S ribosomal subunit assembly/export protein LOC1 n=1 Tax=Bionectria ochroleuca TaxID=29856 RepID=A0A8H7N4C9_BIOOC